MGILDRVTTEAPAQPSRVYLYAAEKWGKTSFAAQAPKPIFLMTAGETGLLDLINYGRVGPTPHFPEDLKAWPDLIDAVRAIADEPHDYQTLVIDTANGAERLLADHVLQNEFQGFMTGKNGYGSYGKGDLACVPHWGQFLRELDRVRAKRRMSIILLAHSRVKTVNNPEGDDYDQLRPEGIDKLWPLTHKWASVIAAGTYKVVVKDDKADGGRDRIIRLRGTAAVVGGNRYGLPEIIPCGATAATAWKAFATALREAKAKVQTNGNAGAKPTAASPQPPPTAGPDSGHDPATGTPTDIPENDTKEHEPLPEGPPAEPPLASPPPANGNAKIGGELVQKIVLLCGDATGLDWPTICEGKDAAKGVPAQCGFTPSAGLKVGQLTPDQGVKLHEWLKAKKAEKDARKRQPKPEPAGVES